MTTNKWRLVILIILLLGVGVYQWVNTAPVWHLYYRDFGEVTSMDELDTLMVQIQNDVAQNFGYTLDDMGFDIEGDSSADVAAFRRDVAPYLDGSYYERTLNPVTGRYQETRALGCHAYGFAWIWEGSGLTPDWRVVGEWEDTWRQWDYASPKAKEAQFSMMGATPTPMP